MTWSNVMEFIDPNPKLREENMNNPDHHQQGQDPMLLSSSEHQHNCRKPYIYMKDDHHHHQINNPFETTTPSSSSKGGYYLQEFHHLDHQIHHHVNIGSSSSNHVYGLQTPGYDPFDDHHAFPNNYGCINSATNNNNNNVEFYDCKPFIGADHHHHHGLGNGQVMDNFQSSGGFLNLSSSHQRNSNNNNNNINDVMGSGSGSDHYMPFDLQDQIMMKPVNFIVPDEILSVTTPAAENAYFKKVVMKKNNNRVLTSASRTSFKGCKKSNVVKGQWIIEEDRLLIQLVEQFGVRKWSHIAQMLPGRIGKQCRERWHNHLRPDIKKDTWSEEEDKVLIQAHIEIGNKWAEIAKRLPGRTENSIKNHWNATKRRQFSKRKCRSKYPRGSILQEYIKSLNLESSSSSKKFQEKSSKGTTTTAAADAAITADKISSNKPSNTYQAQAELDFSSSADRLVPEYDFNEVPDFSFDEKLLHDSCSLASLLDDIPSAPVGADAEDHRDKRFDVVDLPVDMVPEVKKELDLVEMISQQANLSN